MIKSRRLAATVAAFALAGAGMLTTANPASAAFSDCPNNNVCLWAGPNGTGILLFKMSGTTMHNNPNTEYRQLQLQANPHAVSYSNRSLGVFCTFSNANHVTNVMGQGSSGSLSSQDTPWVGAC
jgi:hypothetical protein